MLERWIHQPDSPELPGIRHPVLFQDPVLGGTQRHVKGLIEVLERPSFLQVDLRESPRSQEISDPGCLLWPITRQTFLQHVHLKFELKCCVTTGWTYGCVSGGPESDGRRRTGCAGQAKRATASSQSLQQRSLRVRRTGCERGPVPSWRTLYIRERERARDDASCAVRGKPPRGYHIVTLDPWPALEVSRKGHCRPSSVISMMFRFISCEPWAEESFRRCSTRAWTKGKEPYSLDVAVRRIQQSSRRGGFLRKAG